MYPVRPVTKTMLLVAVCHYFCVSAIAQKTVPPDHPGGNVIRGKIVDTAEKKNLHYSIVALIDLADSTLYRSLRANEAGEFEFTQIPAGRYTLMISYPKMADFLQELTVTDTSGIELKTIPMVSKADLLQEVVVRAGYAIRMRGDTLEYNADSFAVRPGANVEEMLKRLPGILVDKDGKIIAQGKEVRKLLVDGDEFFSADPKFASRYLQADAIEKVQVYDDKSDNTKFTGIDDGQRTKTINLKLKRDRKNGVFGKLSAGSNGKDYYQHEAMGALFNGSRKLSLFGMSAKTGRQDLSFTDLFQITNQDYETINDGTGGFSLQGLRAAAGLDGESTSSGLPAVQLGGAHYSDKWNEGKTKLFTNYRIKQVNATGWSNSSNTNVLPDGTSFTNKNESQDKSYSFMQKGSGSFSFEVDSFSTVKISANGNLVNSNGSQSTTSSSTNEKDIQVNNSEQTTRNNGTNKTFGTNINYQRKFRKEGRTLSFNLQQDYKNTLGDSYNFSANNYYDPATGQFKNADTLNQLQESNNLNESYAAKLNYSDMLSSNVHLGLEYGWKNSTASSVFNTLNQVNEKFTDRVDSLSSNYTFGSTTHITGTTLSYTQRKLNLTMGGKALFTSFNQEDNDLHATTTRHFVNLAPQVNFSYMPKLGTSITVGYFGQTMQPTLDQLQPLQRSSNKLNVLIGNPDLRPAFSHSGNIGFGGGNFKKGNFFNTSIGISYTSNNITTQTFTDAQNRTTSQYINLNSIPSLNLSASYSWIMKRPNLKPAIMLSAGKNGNYSIQNGQKLKNENLNFNASVSLSYELKNVMNTSYRGSISQSTGWSDIPGRTDTRSLFHTHTINAIFYLPGHIDLSNDCLFNFQPKNASFNTNFNTITWNASLQKKFGKNDQAVLKLAANDILNNNTGYTRSVIGSNVSESNRFVLKRYWLLSLTWNFTKSIKQ